jgi:LETM1 and EF-hand domain-containing protein 1
MLRRLASNSLLRQHSLVLLRSEPVFLRHIHISSVRKQQQQNPTPLKEETNVEKAIRTIKEARLLAMGQPEVPVPEPVAKLPLLTRIKNEALHYWSATKLLGVEVRISSKLVLKLMRGNRLSRREQRQVSLHAYY